MFKSSTKYLIESIVPGLTKRYIRKKIVDTAFTSQYPFEPEMKLICGIVPPQKPFFDVGANQGHYSILVEDLVGSQNVYCFEPIPKLSNRLRRILPAAHILPVALSDHENTQVLTIPSIGNKVFETRATLEKSVQENAATTVTEIQVNTTTIDRFMAQNQLQALGFVKIDVEGHEQAVLKGGITTLLQFQPLLLVEIEQRHHSYPMTEIFVMIESLGYAGFYFEPETRRLKEIQHFSVAANQNVTNLHSQHYINNFLFTPKQKVNDLHEAFLRMVQSL